MTITAEIRAIVERVKNLGPEWHHTASKLEDAARAAEDARADRLAFLENCLTQTTDRLAKLKEEIRTLPEQIAKWEAERAHLEASTAIGLMMGDAKGGDANAPRDPNDSGRRNVAPPSVGKAEGASDPFIPGLPPLRLREVWAEWEVLERGEPADLLLVFSTDGRLCKWADGKEWFAVVEGSAIWDGRSMRPHGKTRAEVEAMADAREKPGEHAADKTPVFGPEDHERCHYCKGIFLKPVELHHSEEECAFLTSQVERGAVICGKKCMRMGSEEEQP